MLRSIVTGVAILGLCAGASAQTQQVATGKTFHRTVAPQHGVYSLESGFQQTSVGYRTGPETLFNNRGGEYYFDTLNQSPSFEYIDEGSFPASGVNGTEQVNELVWEYCSFEPDDSGGIQNNPGSVMLMYNETVFNVGATGWPTFQCGYTIGGLPQWDGNPLGLNCWIITLDLSGGFECTLPQEATVGGQETFGWSNTYLAPNTGPVFGSTNGYGVVDGFEWYDLNSVGSEYQFNVFFGGGAKAQANWNMEFNGLANDTVAYYSASPLANDTVQWNSTTEIRPGGIAGWNVENVDGVSNYGMLVSNGSADSPIVAGGTASLLVDAGGLLTSPIPMGTVGTFATTLPGSVPANIFTQAVAHTGALTPPNTTAASNGLQHSN
ncbi:MAG: hypothetical protein ACYTF3_06640 [Planctomycetota bacterium]|jgi:hypothetical protein